MIFAVRFDLYARKLIGPMVNQALAQTLDFPILRRGQCSDVPKTGGRYMVALFSSYALKPIAPLRAQTLLISPISKHGNSFCSEQLCVGGDQSQFEYFSGGNEKCVRRISVGQARLPCRESNLCCERRFPEWGYCH
jgi:hypothetical protein